MFGIVDFGFLFQRYVVLTNAAVEGARVATMPGYTAADAQARVQAYVANALPARVRRDRRGGRRVTLPGAGGGTWPGVQVTVTHVYTLQYIAPIITLVGGTTAANGHADRALDHAAARSALSHGDVMNRTNRTLLVFLLSVLVAGVASFFVYSAVQSHPRARGRGEELLRRRGVEVAAGGHDARRRRRQAGGRGRPRARWPAATARSRRW